MSSRPRNPHDPHFDLQPLLEFSNVVNSSVDLRFILNTLLFTIMGKMVVSRGVVLVSTGGSTYSVVVSRGVNEFHENETIEIPRPPTSPVPLNARRAVSREWIVRFSRAGLVLIIPIVVRKKVVGLLALGNRAGGLHYSRADQDLIATLVGLTGAAIEKAMFIEELRKTNRSLDRKIQELNTLFELSKEFNIGMDAQRVIRLLTFSLLGQIGVSKYAICYESNGRQSVVASKGEIPFDVAASAVALNDLHGGVCVDDLRKSKHHRQVAAQLAEAGFRVVIPMHVHQNMKGMILLGEKLRGEPYNEGDLEFLYSLGNLACVSIENARLFQEALLKQRMEDEMIIARDIQQGLLPRTLPTIPGFDIAALNISSQQVGGDYYDILRRGTNEYVIAIGDVSGKGMPAALLMANVQAAMRALVSMRLPLAETTARINDLTTENTRSGNFITLFWGILNSESRELAYVNAGHNYPFLIRADGTVDQLEVGGMILGMMKTTSAYNEGRVTLAPGDLLFLYTDGVSEAMNAAGVDFTEERLLTILQAHHTQSAQEIINAVRDALTQYTQGTPQSDDITMLVLRAL